MRIALLSIALLASVSTACRSTGGGPGPTSVLSGTVTYRERIALPDHALVDVRLLDVSDANTRLIGQVQFPSNGRQVPLPFELHFVDALILPEHAYALTASISAGGELLFHTPTPIGAQMPLDDGQVELLLHSAR
jgi:putative lipoprotein